MDFNSAYKEARMSASEGTELTVRTYNLAIGVVVLWGLLVNYIMYTVFAEQIVQMHPVFMVVIYFVGSLSGMLIVYKSPNAVVSFLGFTVLTVAMGLLLTFLLNYYSAESILLAIRITGITTVLMIGISLLKPELFLGLGRTLLVSLGVCLVVQLILHFFLGMRLGILDWVVALIFCGYIGFDWSRAQLYPMTLDNAVDSAADIYVDIINLFIRILAIVGRSQSDD